MEILPLVKIFPSFCTAVCPSSSTAYYNGLPVSLRGRYHGRKYGRLSAAALFYYFPLLRAAVRGEGECIMCRER
eukprot:scaffold34630_cov185-Amphora_coffeaeformis.AAC.11